jgi:hypothetical protein
MWQKLKTTNINYYKTLSAKDPIQTETSLSMSAIKIIHNIKNCDANSF